MVGRGFRSIASHGGGDELAPAEAGRQGAAMVFDDCEIRDNGFTLLEVLVAVVVLSIGLLGIAGVTASVMRGNSFVSRVTTATTLVQEQMEEIKRLGYAGIPSADTTTVEDYASMANHPLYKRVVSTALMNPACGTKRVTVTVYWDSDTHSVSLKTIVAE